MEEEKETGGDIHNGAFNIDESLYEKPIMRRRIIRQHCKGCDCELK